MLVGVILISAWESLYLSCAIQPRSAKNLVSVNGMASLDRGG